MMIEESSINQVCTAIQNLNSDKKLIIGIEGYSGSGKSTLLRAIQKQIPDVLAVHRDDFLTPREEWEKIFRRSSDKGKALEYISVQHEKILELAEIYNKSNAAYSLHLRADETAKATSGKADILCTFDFSKRIMIIEGVFLFHPKLFDSIFDYRIFIDADQEEADEKRRKREKQRWGEQYFPDTHPDNYFRLLKIVYNDYLEKYQPAHRADYIINTHSCHSQKK